MLAKRLNLSLVIFLQLILLVNFSFAEEIDPALEAKAKAIFEDVFSPFCPGRSLNDCPSSNAHELKDQIRSELKAGKEPEAILQSIFTQYGEQYRALPKPSGIGIFAWALPGAFLLIGAVIILLTTKKRKVIPTTAQPMAPAKIDSKIASEIEAVLKETD